MAECQALVKRSTGSWFDFGGCLNDGKYRVEVAIVDGGDTFTAHVCQVHARSLNDGDELDVHDGTYTKFARRPGIATVRSAILK